MRRGGGQVEDAVVQGSQTARADARCILDLAQLPAPETFVTGSWLCLGRGERGPVRYAIQRELCQHVANTL